MVKPRARFESIRVAIVVLSSGWFAAVGCSGAKVRTSPAAGPIGSPLPEASLRPQPLWTQKVSGIITDLSVSRDGSAVLVATVPNPDAAQTAEADHGLLRYDRKGRKLWRVELEGVVKAMALSDDGKLALVSTYANELIAIDARGKIVWTIEGMCKPIPLGKRFLCYHDDDAEPRVAFDVISEQGKKLSSYPIERDVLALRVSGDDRHVVLALDGGEIILLGPDLRPLWRREVGGEVVDLAVSSGARPRVAALFNSGQGARGDSLQGLAAFDSAGNSLGAFVPAARLTQLEMPSDGQGVAGYGNGAQGQYAAYYMLPSLAEKWSRGDARTADFSSSILLARDQVILGFEDNTETARQSALVAFDENGRPAWSLPVSTEEGAYLYAQAFASQADMLVVGTDDGTLSAFALWPRQGR